MVKVNSAQKAARSSEKKQERNRAVKSSSRTYLSSADKAIAGGDKESAKLAVKETISKLDKAAKKKVIHPNTVSRHKSRLTKKVNKMAESTGEKAIKPAAKKGTRKKTAK